MSSFLFNFINIKHCMPELTKMEHNYGKLLFIFIALCLFSRFCYTQENSSKVTSQNPSPMVEHTRLHERIPDQKSAGVHYTIYNLLEKPFDIFIPQKCLDKKRFDLLIHFHGASYVVNYAASHYNGNIIAVSISLGTGSSVYYNQFNDSTKFFSIIDSAKTVASRKLKHHIDINRIILSGFSAGYGAVKKILSYESAYKIVNAVLLLDGLHASYIPERKVIYEGGHIDSSAYKVFIKFAEDAAKKNSKKKYLFTHSEIFPGTFVSTTESADYLTDVLGLKSKPVLKWGPLGMQQLSDVKKNHFRIMGFAGNTAPDHIDHFQSLFYFLNLLMKL